MAAGRRVNYGSVAPDDARRIFVHEALTHGRCRLRARFLAHNGRVRAALKGGEAKLRRRGVLLDEDGIDAFYLGRIPVQVHTLVAFERWRKEAEARDPAVLCFSAEDVIAAGAPVVDPLRFPERLAVAGHELPLGYRFEPGEAHDGATLSVPIAFLQQLSTGQLEWGVPGWLPRGAG